MIYLDDYKGKQEIAKLLQRQNENNWNGGDTYLDKAFHVLINEGLTPSRGSRKNVPQIAVVITDGQSTDPLATEIALQRLRQKNFITFAIGRFNILINVSTYIYCSNLLCMQS